MKKTTYRKLGAAAMAAIALSAFSACSDYNPDQAFAESYGYEGIKFSDKNYYVSVYETSFNFPYEGGEAASYFFSSEEWWLNPVMENEVESTRLPEWLSFNATSGKGSTEDQELIITAAENSAPEARVAVFGLLSGKDELLSGSLLSVSQVGSQPYIVFADGAPDSYSVGREGGTVNVAIRTNVSVPDGLVLGTSSSFYGVEDYEFTSDNIRIVVAPNSSTNARVISLSVHCRANNSSISFTISQEGASFGINEEVVQNIPVTGGTLPVNLTSQSSWRAQADPACQSWVSVSPTSGAAGTSQISITVAANNSNSSRIGYVNIYPDGQPTTAGITVTLKQSGQQIEASENSLSFNAAGSTQQITLNANVDWIVSSKPGWITVSPNSGNAGTQVVQFAAAANPTGSARSAEVVFSVRGSDARALTISCGQTGKGQDIPEGAIAFGWAGGTHNVSISAAGAWQAAQSDPWISLSAYSGNGPSQLTITADKNETSDYRQGKVYIYDSASGNPIELTIVQENQYLIIDNNSGIINAQGGSIRLDYYSSVGAVREIWTSESNHTAPSWLHVEQHSSSSDNYYTLTADANPSGEDRQAIFVIKPAQSGVTAAISQGVQYRVTQRGRQLSASVSEITLMPAGGTTPTYTITADGDYEISKATADFWYVLTSNKLNNSFSIIATPNTGSTTRTGMITLRLLNTPAGSPAKTLEIPVVQFPEGTNFITGGFGEEVNWDL